MTAEPKLEPTNDRYPEAPCYFCKGTELDTWDAPIKKGHPKKYHAGCYGCGSRGPSFESRREAIAAWNRRATPVAPDVERLVAAATAVVDRWETPNWKETEHTAVFIHALRDCLAAMGRE